MVIATKPKAVQLDSGQKITVTSLSRLDGTSDYPWRLRANVPFTIFVNIRREGKETKIKFEAISTDVANSLAASGINLEDKQLKIGVIGAICEKMGSNSEYNDIKPILEKWLQKNNPSSFQRRHL